MEGTDVAIADPIAALDDHDDRPSVKDLIEENREHIDKLKAEIAEDSHYNPTKHDDLWLLRFLLSHKKKLTPSVKAARTTLAFRHEHRLDAEDLRDYPMDRTTVKCPPGSIILEDLKAFMRNVAENSITYGIPDPRRGVVGYLCLGAKICSLNILTRKRGSVPCASFRNGLISGWIISREPRAGLRKRFAFWIRNFIKYLILVARDHDEMG